MTVGNARRAAHEVVPLAERVRLMQVFRIAVACVVMVSGALMPGTIGASVGDLAKGTALLLVVSVASEGAWRLLRQRSLTLFGTMLIVDGIYFAWLVHVTGGIASPLRSLILLHLITVALLASYRTGLKLALWHSLLLLGVYHTQESGLLGPAGAAVEALPGSPFQQLTAFIVSFWLVAVATASFSSVNERELRRRRYDLEALARLATELEGVTNSGAAGDVLLDNCMDAFGFQRAALLAARVEELSLLAFRAPERPQLRHGRPAPDSLLERARTTRETLLVSHLPAEEDPWLASLMPAARNVVIVPLSAEGRAVGVLVAEHAMRRGSRIERRVVSMLERFASYAALALRNAWLLEEMENMASTDGLTAIANRRTFDSTLAREVARAARTGEAVSLVVLDIDHFKRLNDKHGHQVGDEVLRQVAGVLAGHARGFDTVARYGGEEFAVILPGCEAEESGSIAERLRAATCDSATVVPVTVSAGVATFPTHALDGPSLLGAADEALYESKRAGRNRVSVSGKGDPVAAPPELTSGSGPAEAVPASTHS